MGHVERGKLAVSFVDSVARALDDTHPWLSGDKRVIWGVSWLVGCGRGISGWRDIWAMCGWRRSLVVWWSWQALISAREKAWGQLSNEGLKVVDPILAPSSLIFQNQIHKFQVLDLERPVFVLSVQELGISPSHG